MSYTAGERLFRVYFSVFEQEAPELILMPAYLIRDAGMSLYVAVTTVQR